MRIELVVNMAMNGAVVLAEHADAYQAPQEISGIVFAKAAASGNLIMGRTTYEMFAPVISQALPDVKVVVLSSSYQVKTVKTVKTPEEAIDYLEKEGFETAVVAGGTQTYNTFLTKNLADDIYMNFFPVAIHEGGRLQPETAVVNAYHLAECKANKDIVMLHYTK